MSAADATPGRWTIRVDVTVEAPDEARAYGFLAESMELAEGQGLMDHVDDASLMTWAIQGLADHEPYWTSCGACGDLNIEIVEDSAPELCARCERDA